MSNLTEREREVLATITGILMDCDLGDGFDDTCYKSLVRAFRLLKGNPDVEFSGRLFGIPDGDKILYGREARKKLFKDPEEVCLEVDGQCFDVFISEDQDHALIVDNNTVVNVFANDGDVTLN